MMSALLCAGMMLTSCDDVKDDDRYEEIKLEDVQPKRGVLLEDFTGQDCVNCPGAHEVIENLEELWGKDNLIAVSIHCGGLAKPIKYTSFDNNRIGLMIDKGNTIMDSYGMDSWPKGAVDFAGPLNPDLWSTYVLYDIIKEPGVKLEARAVFEANETNEKSGDIHIKATIEAESELKDAAIQFYIVEDGIVAEQKMISGEINKEYVHNNVLRDMVYDLAGEPIQLLPNAPFTIETTVGCKYTNKERWNQEKLRVIAFVFTVKDGVRTMQEVIQVPLEKGVIDI